MKFLLVPVIYVYVLSGVASDLVSPLLSLWENSCKVQIENKLAEQNKIMQRQQKLNFNNWLEVVVLVVAAVLSLGRLIFCWCACNRYYPVLIGAVILFRKVTHSGIARTANLNIIRFRNSSNSIPEFLPFHCYQFPSIPSNSCQFRKCLIC